MPVTTPTAPTPRYHAIFPAWEGTRPVAWFFAEHFLEARSASDFPTNAEGNDEDVNVYVIGLLVGWVLGDGLAGILPGRDPLLLPPDGSWPAWRRAEHHRRQADHRLLAMGLFDRGDLLRRRQRGWWMTEAETRERDLTVLVSGYRQAADLLDDRTNLATVWRKLARHAPRYLQVLQILARRRLGLGARLNDGDMERLLVTAPQG